jgi:ADP-ribose pyrophosphatase YjhB (NUDIX family)
MIRRKGEPERGKWSFPAGFMDAGEDPARAAEREAVEETGLRVRVTALFEVFPKFGPTEGADLLIVYRAEIAGGELQAGDDAERVAFFAPENLPTELAFISTEKVLAQWRARR